MDLPNDISSCHRIILELVSVLEGIKPQLEGYIQQIEEQRNQIEIQSNQVAAQRNQITQLELRVKELEAQINQNSRNSSRPPSSDLYRKKPAFPRVKGGKIGGKKGHDGGTLKSQNEFAGAQLEADEAHIKAQLLQSEVVHFDETGFYVGKQRYWEHVASNERYTYLFVHRNRGKKAHEGHISCFSAPFVSPNRLWERDIRPTKTKMKVSGCFRTEHGAEIYARVQSFVSTVRKLQFNPFNELYTVLSGGIPKYRCSSC